MSDSTALSRPKLYLCLLLGSVHLHVGHRSLFLPAEVFYLTRRDSHTSRMLKWNHFYPTQAVSSAFNQYRQFGITSNQHNRIVNYQPTLNKENQKKVLDNFYSTQRDRLFSLTESLESRIIYRQQT